MNIENDKTVFKIKEYLEANRIKKDNIKKKLSKTYPMSISEEKKYRKKLKNELKQVRKNIADAETLFEKYSTFDSASLLIFLEKYLSIIENEEYALIGDDNYHFDISNYKFVNTNTYGEQYYIITTEANCDILENSSPILPYCFQTCDIDDFLSECKDGKYIYMEQQDRYSLLKKEKLNQIFKNYPYLEDVAYDLVDLKIENPEMTDRERLNMVYLKSKKNKTYSLKR